MTLHTFIYLASQSPRRRQLLDQLGVRHELLVPAPGAEADAAEALEAVQAAELPTDYVQRVTALKLRAARARLKARGLPGAPILCSDTTVAIGRRILGKPADADEARAMLQALGGRSHRVLTAVAVGTARRTLAALSVSTVRFAPLDAALIDASIASGQPFGKAGGYAIQSQLAGWIPEMRGSHSAIMGLPLFETAQLLRQAHVRF